MRGAESHQSPLFSYVSLEDRIPKDHPLRVIKALVDPILRDLSPQFDALYATKGRPSIPPEMLLRALLLQILYSVRSERMLMEQLDYNLLFRWFVGLNLDAEVWVPTTFTKNRDRLLEGEIAHAFFAAVVEQARKRRLLSDEHFTVDGTLLEAWASQKSFRPKDGPPPPKGEGRNPDVQFRGEKRSNATHQSTTDPDARLAKKGPGKEAKLSYSANVLMENRHGLIVDTEVTHATGTAEVESALAMLERQPRRARRRTIGADKLYDTKDFVRGARTRGFTPHVAQNTNGRRSTIGGRTTRHVGYAESQKRRKMVEENFGWSKTVGLLRKLRHRGAALVSWVFAFTSAAYNLVRLRTLILAGVCP
jgi:transposase